MRILYETDRMNACLVDPSFARVLLSYEKHNRCRFSATHPESYYTEASFIDLCERQCSLMEQKRMVYLLFFAKSESRFIRAAVQLNHIVYGISRSAKIGYSVDKDYHRQGYGKEAVASVINYAFKAMNLHRIEANIAFDNEASLALVASLGFAYEGVCKGYLRINGKWEDHLRYALLNEHDKST